MFNSLIQSDKQQLFIVCAFTVCTRNVHLLILHMPLVSSATVWWQSMTHWSSCSTSSTTHSCSSSTSEICFCAHCFLRYSPRFVRKHFRQAFCSIFFLPYCKYLTKCLLLCYISLWEHHICWRHSYVINNKEYLTSIFSCLSKLLCTLVNMTRSYVRENRSFFWTHYSLSFSIIHDALSCDTISPSLTAEVVAAAMNAELSRQCGIEIFNNCSHIPTTLPLIVEV